MPSAFYPATWLAPRSNRVICSLHNCPQPAVRPSRSSRTKERLRTVFRYTFCSHLAAVSNGRTNKYMEKEARTFRKPASRTAFVKIMGRHSPSLSIGHSCLFMPPRQMRVSRFQEGCKTVRRCELLGVISMFTPGCFLSVETMAVPLQCTDHKSTFVLSTRRCQVRLLLLALFEWFPSILREPLSASDTLSEATAPVKLPSDIGTAGLRGG